MTYTKNIQKLGFRTELTSSKACYVGFHDRVSRQGNESAWLETPWVLFLALTDQMCSLRYWCPVGTSCYPRCPVRAHTHAIPPKVIFREGGKSCQEAEFSKDNQSARCEMLALFSRMTSQNVGASVLSKTFSLWRYT